MFKRISWYTFMSLSQLAPFGALVKKIRTFKGTPSQS